MTSEITRAELRDLLRTGDPVCVSICMPTERAGRQTRQNRIRFKNLVSEARSRLAELSVFRPLELDEFLEDARALQDDTDFWQHQRGGLAAYFSDSVSRAYRLPFPAGQDLAVVGRRFHVKPLLAAMTAGARFHVLVLHRDGAALYDCTRDEIEQVDVPGLPASLEEVVGSEVEPEHVQRHTGSGAAGRGQRPAVFHGQGGGRDDTEAEARGLLRQVDAAVRPVLETAGDPLVIAGEDPLRAAFRDVCRVAGGVAAEVAANPGSMSPDELRRRACEAVEPVVRRDRERAADRFRELADTPRTSTAIETIDRASREGRVDVLFVETGRQAWRSGDDGAEDLLDRAAAETLLHGGTVFATAGSDLPVPASPIAALFRY